MLGSHPTLLPVAARKKWSSREGIMATREDRLFRTRNTEGISVGEAALWSRKKVYCAVTDSGCG